MFPTEVLLNVFTESPMVLMFAIQLRFASQNLWSVQAAGVAELHTKEHEEFGTHRQSGER